MKNAAQLARMDESETHCDLDDDAETLPLPTLQNQLRTEAENLGLSNARLDEIIKMIRSLDDKVERLLESRPAPRKTARKTAKKAVRKKAGKTVK